MGRCVWGGSPWTAVTATCPVCSPGGWRLFQTEGTKEEMDDGGDELTMFLVLSWTWEICLPAYTLYIAWSYYMEIDRGQRIGFMFPDLIDYLDPNAIPMEHYILPPSGQVVLTHGHCAECFQVRDSLHANTDGGG